MPEPFKRAVIIDANPDKRGLHIAWKLGALRSRHLAGFDRIVEAKTWIQAMKDLGDEVYDEIQFYGHASPGTFCIGKDNEITDEDLALLAKHLRPSSLVWLRGCASFHGETGHALALRMTRLLGCRVAAHTFIIGFPWHSGGHSLRPNQKPSWPTNEAATSKPQKSGWKIRNSGKREPNTLSFLATDFPAKW